MAESKVLIKEYERVAKEDPSADLDAIADRKRDFVKELNRYVNQKKSLQADIAAKAAMADDKAPEAAAAGFAAAAAAKAASSGKDAGSGEKGGRGKREEPASEISPAEDAALPPMPPPTTSKKKKRGEVVEPTDVELQTMEMAQVVDYGRSKMRETEESVARSRKQVAQTIELGTLTAASLSKQTAQMEKVVDDLDEIHFSLKKSMKVIKSLTKALATDKCIMTLMFIMTCGIVAVIIVNVTGITDPGAARATAAAGRRAAEFARGRGWGVGEVGRRGRRRRRRVVREGVSRRRRGEGRAVMIVKTSPENSFAHRYAAFGRLRSGASDPDPDPSSSSSAAGSISPSSGAGGGGGGASSSASSSAAAISSDVGVLSIGGRKSSPYAT
jgi:SNARE protein